MDDPDEDLAPKNKPMVTPIFKSGFAIKLHEESRRKRMLPLQQNDTDQQTNTTATLQQQQLSQEQQCTADEPTQNDLLKNASPPIQ